MMFRSALRLLTLLLVGMALPSCSRAGDNGFVNDVVISPDAYEITELACTPRVAQAMVDDELVDETQWWGRGIITNRLSTDSPNYQLRYSATFDDGTTAESLHAQLIFVMPPAGSQEFSFLVSAGDERTPTGCTVEVFDSVANY